MGRQPVTLPHSTFFCQFLSLQPKTQHFKNGQARNSEFHPLLPASKYCLTKGEEKAKIMLS
jgi:hypothetical protein